MTDEQITIGEIYRLVRRTDERIEKFSEESVQRHHRLREDMQPMVRAITELQTEMKAAKEDIGELNDDMKNVRRDAAFLSGGISLGALLLSVIGWPWGHK